MVEFLPQMDFSKVQGELDQAMVDSNAATADLQEAELAAQIRRQELTNAARHEAERIADQARESSAQTRDQQLQALSNLDDTARVAQEAIALSDSDNPLDHMKLWFMQQSDDRYTVEGNNRRMNNLNQTVAAFGTREIINQQGYAAALAELETNIQRNMQTDDDAIAIMATVDEQAATNLDELVRQQNIINNTMANDRIIIDRALTDATDDQLQAAVNDAGAAGNSFVSVGGVSDIPLEAATSAIQARKINHMEFAALEMTHESIQLLDATPAQLEAGLAEVAAAGPSGLAVVNGVQVTRSQIQGAQIEQTNSDAQLDLARATRMDAAKNLRNHQELEVLAGMSNTTIERLAGNSGKTVLPNGNEYQYDLANVNAENAKRIQAAQQALGYQLNQSTLENPASNLAQRAQEVQADLDRAGSILTPGGVAERALTEQVTALTAFANLPAIDPNLRGTEGFSGDTIETQMSVADTISRSHQAVQNAFRAEADARYPNNSPRADAMFATLMNRPVDLGTITNSLSDAMDGNRNGQTLLAWLDNDAAQVYRNAYGTAMANVSLLDNPTETQRKADAAHAAMQQLTRHLNSRNDRLFMQVQSEDGAALGVMTPLVHAGVSANDMIRMSNRADRIALRNFADQRDLDEETLNALQTHSVQDPALRQLQQAEFILQLNQHTEGLGDAYAEWWQSSSVNEFSATLESVLARQSQGDLQRSVAYSITQPTFAQGINDYSYEVGLGAELLQDEEFLRQQQSYMTFQGNSVRKQVFLLESDPALSSAAKQDIMRDLIMPLITEGKARELQGQQLDFFIERELRNSNSQDPVIRALQRDVRAGRETALSTMNNFLYANAIKVPLGFLPFVGPMLGINSPLDAPLTHIEQDVATGVAVKGYTWWQDIAEEF